MTTKSKLMLLSPHLTRQEHLADTLDWHPTDSWEPAAQHQGYVGEGGGEHSPIC